LTPTLSLHASAADVSFRVFCEETFPLLDVKGSTARGGSVAAREVAPGTTIYVYSGDDAVSSSVRDGHGWEDQVLDQVLWAMQEPLPPPSGGTEAAPGRTLKATTAAAAAAANASAHAAVDAAAGTLAASARAHGGEEQPPPPLFVDVGANVGWFSVNVAARGYRVAAFEGMATNVALVRSSVCASPGLGDRLRLYAFGLGAADDTCYLFSGTTNRGDGITMCGVASEAEATAKVPPGYALRGRLPIHRLDSLLQPPPPGAAAGHANEIKVRGRGAGMGTQQKTAASTQVHPPVKGGEYARAGRGLNTAYTLAGPSRLSTAGFKGPWMTEAEVH
ncbi:hypothetical protein TSOC_000756, partial [Tetrabaena socialis]